MISQRSRGFYELFIVLQFALVTVCYWAHFFLIERVHSPAALPINYVVYYVLFLGGLIFEALHRNRNGGDYFQTGLRDKHSTALRQVLYTALPVTFFLVATRDQVISRLFLFTFLPELYVVLLISSRYLPRLVAKLTFDASRRDRTLLVGSSRRVLALQGWLAGKATLGVETVGVLCDEKLTDVGGLPVLGKVDQLERIVREHNIHQVVVVELPSFSIFLSKLANACELLGVRLLVMSDLEEKFRHRVIYLENDGKHFFALRQEPLENPFNRALKRTIDITVALPIVLFVLPPLWTLVWFLQRRQSPGPVFYLQDRRGFHNRVFKIIKFRTMHENQDPTQQATHGDARIFPAGRWLRRLSLDEIPQFLNVLLGEMSVVGPRPHLQEHNDSFSRVLQNYRIRALVKPGISGLAQVKGLRGEASDEKSLKERIESDIFYLENWSLGVDLSIIFRTAWRMWFPPKSVC